MNNNFEYRFFEYRGFRPFVQKFLDQNPDFNPFHEISPNSYVMSYGKPMFYKFERYMNEIEWTIQSNYSFAVI